MTSGGPGETTHTADINGESETFSIHLERLRPKAKCPLKNNR